jgi:hypothetical protein
MKLHLGGQRRCLYRSSPKRGRLLHLFFGRDLQLFVPSAQKDARLARVAIETATAPIRIAEK